MPFSSSDHHHQQQQHQTTGIIKTTARFQETQEPLRQKPIIQIDPNAPLQQYENLARASIDSGRDNPFRPDGKIYKSADPIVDYYKHGPHQSRTQSPTDSKLLIGGDYNDDDEAEELVAGKKNKKNKNKKEKKRARRKGETGATLTLSSSSSSSEMKKNIDLNEKKKKKKREQPCWRRWICCCCCCFEEGGCCSRKNQTTKLDEEEEKFDTSQYESPPSVDAKTKDFKQSKIVVLQTITDDSHHSDQSILRNGQNGPHDRVTTTDESTETIIIPIPVLTAAVADKKLASTPTGTQKEKQTEPKKITSNESSKCVIS